MKQNNKDEKINQPNNEDVFIMMEDSEDLHWKAVQDWNKIYSKNLTSLQDVQLLEKTIHKIEPRARTTSSITADILTKPLHNELLNVTLSDPEDA